MEEYSEEEINKLLEAELLKFKTHIEEVRELIANTQKTSSTLIDQALQLKKLQNEIEESKLIIDKLKTIIDSNNNEINLKLKLIEASVKKTADSCDNLHTKSDNTTIDISKIIKIISGIETSILTRVNNTAKSDFNHLKNLISDNNDAHNKTLNEIKRENKRLKDKIIDLNSDLNTVHSNISFIEAKAKDNNKKVKFYIFLLVLIMVFLNVSNIVLLVSTIAKYIFSLYN